MKNWKELAISPEAPIREAIAAIERGSIQICLVVDENDRLLGTVTDGDIRRGVLRGVAFEDKVTTVMNIKPFTATPDDDPEDVLNLMEKRFLNQVPICDSSGKVVRLLVNPLLLPAAAGKTDVVIMAGGAGTRLRPLTDDCPKPLLRIGNKPILEIILKSLASYGFKRFQLAVNYKAEMIQEYFGDGSAWDWELEYIFERTPLGTAGALSLMRTRPGTPFLVMNGDLLTNVNFNQLLDFHNESESIMTVCVREYHFEVPYGVVKLEKHRITEIKEKPQQSFFVNAGLYVLDPITLDFIPKNTRYDMTTLLSTLIGIKRRVVAFPIREYWIDIGRKKEYHQAKIDYFNHSK